MWPASALLTGNGVAFILRVPGTQHGDWWSMHGWWIYAATAAVSLLSKYVIVWRGGHIFNPSNIGLVLCFLVLGKKPRRAARLLVGPDVAVARARVRGHHHRRARDPLAAAAAEDRGHVLALVRRGRRGARGDGTCDDRALAPRADHGLRVLVGAAHVAGGPRLPVLHAHGSEDVAERPDCAHRVRGECRAAGGAADRAAAHGVRDQGRAARRAGDRVRRSAAAGAASPRPASHRRCATDRRCGCRGPCSSMPPCSSRRESRHGRPRLRRHPRSAGACRGSRSSHRAVSSRS